MEYHRVANVEKTRVRALDTVHYLDKTDSNLEKTQQGEIQMICVETTNAADFAVKLSPGHQDKMKTLVRVADF